MNKFWGGNLDGTLNCDGTWNQDGTWADRNEFPLSASSLTLQQHTAAADFCLVGPEWEGELGIASSLHRHLLLPAHNALWTLQAVEGVS